MLRRPAYAYLGNRSSVHLHGVSWEYVVDEQLKKKNAYLQGRGPFRRLPSAFQDTIHRQIRHRARRARSYRRVEESTHLLRVHRSHLIDL